MPSYCPCSTIKLGGTRFTKKKRKFATVVSTKGLFLKRCHKLPQFERASAGLGVGPHCEVCNKKQTKDQESDYSHGPGKSNLRKKMIYHNSVFASASNNIEVVPGLMEIRLRLRMTRKTRYPVPTLFSWKTMYCQS